MKGVRVLLVDDEQELIETLAKRMKARGLEVTTAGSGELAVEEVRGGAFEVLVLDLSMPGIDGIETLKRVLEIDPDLQVIFLTGHATIETAFSAMKLGAADFLEKPTQFQELLAKVEAAAAKKLELVEKHREERIDDILHRKW